MSNKIGEYVNRQERYQFAFIKCNTITEAIERAKKNWNNTETSVILIDVKKTYDTVRTDVLETLEIEGEHTTLLWGAMRKIYRHLLRMRISRQILLKGVGLPQGSALS